MGKQFGSCRFSLLTGSELVAQLPVIRSVEILRQWTGESECPLCKEDYKVGEGVSHGDLPALLECGHCFCHKCIEAWLSEFGSNHCPMCRQILIASYTDDFEQRQDRLLNHAFNGALAQGLRSDVELYDVLRLRDTRLSLHDPQVAVLNEDQERQMFYKLCYSRTFVFQMPEEHRDGAEWIVQLAGQYYGLRNITGEWTHIQLTIFPRRIARGFLQRALDEGQDLKLR